MQAFLDAALADSAAMTKHGPPGTVLDSRFLGNDPPEADLRRTGGLGVSKGEHEVRPCMAVLSWCPPEADRESEGVPRFLSLLSPKIEDPPQEEWGPGG